MIESVQVRHRGAYDFETHYDNLCALQDSCPLTAVKAHLSQGVLDLNGDRIRANDWMPVLNTLRINKSLEFVAIRSYYTPPSDDNEKKAMIEKRKTPSVRSKEITYRMCKALKECLGLTPVL
ncbi:CEP78-like protein, partial [Mya arenaria]